jgi:WD40 repeat protein
MTDQSRGGIFSVSRSQGLDAVRSLSRYSENHPFFRRIKQICVITTLCVSASLSAQGARFVPQLWLPSANKGAFSADGRNIVLACEGGSLILCEAQLGRELSRLTGHKDSVTSASFSPDGRKILTSSLDKTARVWNLSSGAQEMVLTGHKDSVTSASFSPDGRKILTSSLDKTARVWNLSSGAQEMVLTGHEDSVTSASFSPDGKKILTVSGSVKVWNSYSGICEVEAERRLIATEDGEYPQVFEFACFSPNGRELLCIAGEVCLKSSKTGLTLTRMGGSFQERALDAAFSQDNRYLIVSGDESVSLVNLRDGLLLRKHENPGIGGQGYIIFPEHGDHYITHWTGVTGFPYAAELRQKGTGRVAAHLPPIGSAAFSSDGTQFATIESANEEFTKSNVVLRNCKTGKQIAGRKLPLLDGSNVGLTHLSNLRKVAICADWLEDLSYIVDFKKSSTPKRLPGGVGTVLFSNDEKVATLSKSGIVRVWQTSDWRMLRTFKTEEVSYGCSYIDTDGSPKFLISNERGLLIIDINRKTTTKLAITTKDSLDFSSFDTNGKTLCSTSGRGLIDVFDLKSVKKRFSIHLFSGESSIVISPDGRYDSSEGATPRFGHFVLDTPDGPEAVSFEQINPVEFYEPGLVKKINEGTYVPRKAGLLSEKPYPKVVQAFDKQSGKLRFSVTDQSGGGIGDVVIRLNGIVVPGLRYSKGELKSGQTTEIDMKKYGYDPGEVVEVLAWNATGYLRSPSAIEYTKVYGVTSKGGPTPEELEAAKDPTPSKFIAVLMGTETFRGNVFKPLQFAGDDVIETAKALHMMATTGGATPEITVITDDPDAGVKLKGIATVIPFATRESWIKTMSKYTQTSFTKNDWLYLGFSGHGVSVNKKYAYITAEATTASPEPGQEKLWNDRVILEDDIEKAFATANSSNKVLVLDTCKAGSAEKIASKQDDAPVSSVVTKFAYGMQGVHLLLGSAADAPAFQFEELKHGLLTYSMLSILRKGADAGTGERARVIQSAAWLDASAKLCEELSAKKGSPQKPQVLFHRDFALGSLTDAQRAQIYLADILPGIYECRIEDESVSGVDWLNGGVMSALEGNTPGLVFSKASNERGADAFIIKGSIVTQGTNLKITIRLTQIATSGKIYMSPPLVITSAKTSAVKDVMDAAKKLYDRRAEWLK